MSNTYFPRNGGNIDNDLNEGGHWMIVLEIHFTAVVSILTGLG